MRGQILLFTIHFLLANPATAFLFTLTSYLNSWTFSLQLMTDTILEDFQLFILHTLIEWFLYIDN